MHEMSFAVINPATEEPIAELDEAGVEALDVYTEWKYVNLIADPAKA